MRTHDKRSPSVRRFMSLVGAFSLVATMLVHPALASTQTPDDERTNNDDDVVTEGGQGSGVLSGNPVTNSGTVTEGGTGLAPLIECKWELLDNKDTNNGFDYSRAEGGKVHFDDDDAKGPSPALPCDQDEADKLDYFQGEGPRGDPFHSIQVLPHPDDQADSDPALEERRVEVWSAVSHPQGLSRISDVHWRVYEWCNVRDEADPHHIVIDGIDDDFNGTESGWCMKAQVHAPSQTSSPSNVTVATPEACDDLGTLTTGMLQAANQTGQVSQAAIGNSSASGSLLER